MTNEVLQNHEVVPQGMLSFSIRDLRVLHSTYMPFIRNGGLFIPTQREYRLGEEIMILLHLMEESERIPVVGKVVWVTPHKAESHRIQGVGIEFDEEEGKDLKKRIESYLGSLLDSPNPTQTF